YTCGKECRTADPRPRSATLGLGRPLGNFYLRGGTLECPQRPRLDRLPPCPTYDRTSLGINTACSHRAPARSFASCAPAPRLSRASPQNRSTMLLPRHTTGRTIR